VAHVAAGLSQQPQAWVGRTLTVRGTLVVVSGGGVGSGFCWPVGRCGFVLPTDVPLHIFLLGPTPRTIPAYAGMLAALLAARAPSLATGPLTQGISYRVWRTAPPVLVVLVRPHRPSAAWAHVSRLAQQAAT